MTQEVCYYCENKAATKMRHNQPACEECNEVEVRTIVRPREKTEKEEATRLKLVIQAFRNAFREEG